MWQHQEANDAQGEEGAGDADAERTIAGEDGWPSSLLPARTVAALATTETDGTSTASNMQMLPSIQSGKAPETIEIIAPISLALVLLQAREQRAASRDAGRGIVA